MERQIKTFSEFVNEQSENKVPAVIAFNNWIDDVSSIIDQAKDPSDFKKLMQEYHSDERNRRIVQNLIKMRRLAKMGKMELIDGFNEEGMDIVMKEIKAWGKSYKEMPNVEPTMPDKNDDIQPKWSW